MSGAKAATVHARSPSQQRMPGAVLVRPRLEQRSTEQIGTPTITLYHWLEYTRTYFTHPFLRLQPARSDCSA